MAWFRRFQITAIDIRDPNGTLALKIPKLPFRWSLGLSQKPSLRIDSVEIVDIELDYRELKAPARKMRMLLSRTEPPRTPEEYEALFQAKLIEIRSLASLLDSLPLSLIIEESRVHFARFHLRRSKWCSILQRPKCVARCIGQPKRCASPGAARISITSHLWFYRGQLNSCRWRKSHRQLGQRQD